MGGSNGSSGGVKDLSLAEATTMAASQAVSWVAALEVLLVTFSTFKRYRGLYFWSLNISAIGVLIKGVTNLLRFFAVVQPIIIPVIINEPAWVMMVTGQSLVLYSRLHLVVKDERKLRMVLWMIIVNGLILHVPTAVFTCGANIPSVAAYYTPIYEVYERIQITGFFIQESIISFLYVYETMKMVRDGLFLNKKGAKKVVRHLIWANIIIVLADLSILVIEFAGLLFMQSCLKSMVYAYKLRLEFSVLNRFMDLVQSKPRTAPDSSHWSGDHNKSNGLHSQAHKPSKAPSYSIFIRKTKEEDKHLGTAKAGEILATTDIDVQSTDAICTAHDSDTVHSLNSIELGHVNPNHRGSHEAHFK